eukprot:CAMPEP_0167753560 /NCGR_PEP_ID=MMETSP0110_2-20121227/7783_1 /TAXON_ID=629695 /ORGANISM="Gymnochlora sp., Strain CCMP2014" /LENGTH=322 /DNA_ID=CAMNT_0007639343 /DNA_START=971 /DNA_END=1939 /DNA_ORIENTATION=+
MAPRDAIAPLLATVCIVFLLFKASKDVQLGTTRFQSRPSPALSCRRGQLRRELAFKFHQKGFLAGVSGRSPLLVFAEEKKEPEFYDAKLLSIEKAAEEGDVYKLVVDSPRAKEQYQIAGQFTQMRAGDNKPGFFAIANKPGEESLEFVIKKVPGTAGALTELSPGDSVEMTDVMGKGFPWDKVSDNEKYNGGTYVFATGTGFGPIKAMIEAGTFKGRSNMKIYYGARSPNHMPFRDQFEAWFKEGLLGDSSEMPIIPVYSCDENMAKKENGYVQDVAVLSSDGVDPATASAIICGHWDMTNVLKQKLTEDFGMPAENILTNF